MRRAPSLAATILAATVPVLSACGSFEDDMRMMCEAPKKAVLTEKDPAKKAEEIARHISRNVRSREARELFQTLPAADPSARTRLLEDAVRRAGIDPAECETLRKYW